MTESTIVILVALTAIILITVMCYFCIKLITKTTHRTSKKIEDEK